MTRIRRHPLACLAACAALAAAGCGSSDSEPEGEPLPADAADQLQRRLDEVERRYLAAVDEGLVDACAKDIPDDSFGGPGGIDEIVAALPADVDPELRAAVEASFENLRTLTAEQCADLEPPPETDTVPEEIPEETIPEETIPEETIPEEIPEETVPEETVPEEPDFTPPGQGGTPPGQGGTPPGQGGGAEVPGLEDDD